MNETVLVTGAAGFVGYNLSQKLLSEGHNVIAVDNFCTGNEKHKSSLLQNPEYQGRVLFFTEDVCKSWAWTKQIPQSWLSSLSRIFHLASPASPSHYLRLSLETLAANSIGLQNALHFADQIKSRVIFSSTSEVYGSNTQSVQKEDDWGRVNSFGSRSCYQEAKRFGEALIYSHNKRHNTRHGLVRIFNTYGPHMNPNDGRVIINFLMQASRGEKLTVFGSGHQTRSFCYISDLVDGLLRYSQKDLTYPVNLGNPEEMTVLDVVHKIANIFPEQRLEWEYHPLPQEDPTHRKPDISLAYEQLDGWTPKVSFTEGLTKMNSWLKENLPQ